MENFVPWYVADELQYVLAHPIKKWELPTSILYGEKDHLTERKVLEQFSSEFNCEYTVIPEGEHWIHTEEQVAFMADWLKKQII